MMTMLSGNISDRAGSPLAYAALYPAKASACRMHSERMCRFETRLTTDRASSELPSDIAQQPFQTRSGSLLHT
jgi:hypothetical protein